MSRRARSRLLARELKRGETYLASDPDDDAATDTEGGATDVTGYAYACPCCERKDVNHFWCGICSTGAIESHP